MRELWNWFMDLDPATAAIIIFAILYWQSPARGKSDN